MAQPRWLDNVIEWTSTKFGVFSIRCTWGRCLQTSRIPGDQEDMKPFHGFLDSMGSMDVMAFIDFNILGIIFLDLI